jgi:hypothetical protein
MIFPNGVNVQSMANFNDLQVLRIFVEDLRWEAAYVWGKITDEGKRIRIVSI